MAEETVFREPVSVENCPHQGKNILIMSSADVIPQEMLALSDFSRIPRVKRVVQNRVQQFARDTMMAENR